jgi:hypothetical protein
VTRDRDVIDEVARRMMDECSPRGSDMS